MSPDPTSHPWWLRTLRWPLWSWRRLGVTAAALVIGTSGLSIGRDALARATGATRVSSATPASDGTGNIAGAISGSIPGTATGAVPVTASGGWPVTGLPSSASTLAATTGIGTGAGSTSPSRSGQASSSARPSPEQVAAARSFVTAWARPKESAAVWYAALRPLVTLRLADLLRNTDPARVPASRVLDPAPTLSPASSPTAAARATPTVAALGATQDVTIRTDGGAVVVTLQWDGKHWLVDSIAPTGQPS